MNVNALVGAAVFGALTLLYNVAVWRYRRRANAIRPTRSVPNVSSDQNVVYCTEEADLRTWCENGTLVLVSLGAFLVMCGAAFPGSPSVQTVGIYGGAVLLAGFNWWQRVLYRIRARRTAPLLFHPSVVEFVKTPTDRLLLSNADILRYGLSRRLRMPILLVVVMSFVMSLASTTATTWFWRFGPPVALVVGLLMLMLMARATSGAVGRSKAVPAEEYLALPVELNATLLRSFSDDHLRMATRTSLRTADFDFFNISARAERFERLLAWAIWPFRSAYALSDPGQTGQEDPGVGRVLVRLEDDWQPVAIELAQRSTSVFVLFG